LSEDRCASILSRSTHSVSKLRPKLHTERDRCLPFQVAIKPLHRSRSALIFYFSRADAIFPFKPNSSTPIAIAAGLV
jgi:hypothetical protein